MYVPEEEEDEEWTERLRVLEDCRNLKKVAGFFLHPERPVVVDDAAATARCYFDRASAPKYDDADQEGQVDDVMADLAALKRLAVDYLHPEVPVTTTDPTACGRNYFDRASSATPVEEEWRDAEERVRILSEMKAMKKLASDYLHPEVPVRTTDPYACGRNYFGRYSAPDTETLSESEERERVMADLSSMKRLAVDYMHPEKPVVVNDPFGVAKARCYFDRYSAPQEEEWEDSEERRRVLEEAAALKKQAMAWNHPELPVEVSPLATARCYFDRYSAPQEEEWEDSEERRRVLEEAAALKKQAGAWYHPERPVEVSPLATARCYFDRPSAAMVEEDVDEERARILADAAALKKSAADFMHPERPVQVDSAFVTARCYFDRPSAVVEEEWEEAEERARVLSEAAALKRSAVDYMHPERPVVTSDPTACGRNYFDRPSAVLQEDWEEAEERVRVLAEAKSLKQLAVDYQHPELPVVTSDPTACGRNYFDRPSAVLEEEWEEAEERARILAEAKALKQVAVDYLHPELPVFTTDPTATARCYFDRASAPVVDPEEQEERERVLADAMALKKLAIDYRHPEMPVVTTDAAATARCFFDRADAPLHDQQVHTFPAHEDDDHHSHHGEIDDHFHMDDDDALFDDMRAEFPKSANKQQPSSSSASKNKNNTSGSGSDEEGKLSRSPSSVMLFNEEPIYE